MKKNTFYFFRSNAIALFYDDKRLFNKIAMILYFLNILLFFLILQSLSFAQIVLLLACVHIIPLIAYLKYYKNKNISFSLLGGISGIFVFLVILFNKGNAPVQNLIHVNIFLSSLLFLLFNDIKTILALCFNIIIWITYQYIDTFTANPIKESVSYLTNTRWQASALLLKIACLFAVLYLLYAIAGKYLAALGDKKTELEEARQEVKNKARQLSYLSESCAAFFFNIDNNGICTEAFGKEHMTHLPNSLLNKSAFEYYKNNADIIGMMNKALSGHSVSGILQSGGLYLDTSWLPIFGHNNQVVGVSGIMIDITQQFDVKHKNRLAAFIAGKISNSVMITDADNKIEWVNAAFTHLTGFGADEVVGQKNNFLDVVEDDAPILAEILEAMKAQIPIKKELRKQHRKGEEYWVNIDITPMFDNDEKLTYYVIIESDITDKKETEGRLRYNNLLFETVFNNLDDFLAIATPEGGLQILKVNEKALELLELTDKSEVIDKPGFIWRKQPLTIEEVQHRNKIIDETGYWKEEVEYQTKNKRLFWGLLTIQRLTLDGRDLDLIKISDISDQVNIRLAVEQQKVFYETIINTVPIKIVMMDKNGRYQFINDQCFGRNPTLRKILIGKSDLDISNFEQDETYRRQAAARQEAIQHAITEKITIEIEDSSININSGEKITEINRIVPIYDAQNQLSMIIGYALDISKRKEIENQIREQRHFFNTILNNIPLQVIVLSNDYRYLYANKEAIKNEEFRKWAIGKTIQEYAEYRNVSNDIMKQRMQLVSTALETKQLSVMEEYYHDLVFIRYMLPIIDENQNIDLLISYGIDITERVRAQQVMQYNEALFETTFNEATDFIAHVDMSTGNITKVNNSGCLLFEADNIEEFMHNTQSLLSEILPNIHEIFSELDSQIQTSFWTSEAECTTLKGNKFWGAVAVKYFYIHEQKFGLIRISNITARKEAEQQLEKYAIELQKANNELERSNKDLEQFAYVASHDLKTPLRNINGFLSLLEKYHIRNIDKDGADLVSSAIKSVGFLEKLINSLLEYSQVIQKRTIENKIDLNDVMELTKHNFRGTNACIEHPKMPSINANFTQMLQLFQNLIANGIKYNQSEFPTITIDFEEINGFYQFSVKDNGIGIEKEYQEGVFTIFRRLHTQQEYEGTGIGLSICKKIVEGYGGKIWIDSEAQEGTTFCFTLPIKPIG